MLAVAAISEEMIDNPNCKKEEEREEVLCILGRATVLILSNFSAVSEFARHFSKMLYFKNSIGECEVCYHEWLSPKLKSS